MKTLICPTCGCSLVRLGITKEKSATDRHHGKEHRFCCQGCADLFSTDPEKYLRQTTDLVVCPTCLAEKPIESVVTMNVGGHEVHFCGCPYCAELFLKSPDFYIQRLEGAIPHEGVLGHEGCCVRPD
ncbi:MAG: YHS domain-containing protein [Phycisphaerales bacterium]